jgi:type IV pilus assembly protein PilB
MSATANRLGVHWNRCAVDQWADLFAVDLDGPHFQGLEGVFVIWHGGPAPRPVAIGRGRINDELRARRADPALLRFKDLTLLTTWARVDPAVAENVLRYLQEALQPIIPGPVPKGGPMVEVNLPGHPPLEGAPLASPGPVSPYPENKWSDMKRSDPGADELASRRVRPPAAPKPVAKGPAPTKKITRLNKLLDDMLAERAKNAPKGGMFSGPAKKAEDDGLVSAVVRLILQEAMSLEVSDIHLEPQEGSLRVRFRIDGLLEEVFEIPNSLNLRVVSNVRVSCSLDPEKGVGTSKPEDARMTTTVGDLDVDVRLSTFPTPYGDKAVMRLIPRHHVVPPLSEIGLRPEVIVRLKELIRQPQGMIIVTGPTGSGKSTTLYTFLSEINEIHRNIVTLEDPIEKRIPGLVQGMIQPKVGFTFSEGLRAILRQDPNVIMVGEIRDTETAEIAMRASLTGHMVLSTLHTNSALGAISRMLDMGLEPFLVASALTAVCAQRLARRVCPDCMQNAAPTAEEATALKEIAAAHGLPLDASGAKVARGVGCMSCRGTGYKGRILLFEMAQMSPGLRQMILRKAPLDEMYALAVKEGAETLLMDGWRKATAGLTTIDELLRVAGTE